MLLNFYQKVLEDTSFQKDIVKYPSERKLTMLVHFSPLVIFISLSFSGHIVMASRSKADYPVHNCCCYRHCTYL